MCASRCLFAIITVMVGVDFPWEVIRKAIVSVEACGLTRIKTVYTKSMFMRDLWTEPTFKTQSRTNLNSHTENTVAAVYTFFASISERPSA